MLFYSLSSFAQTSTLKDQPAPPEPRDPASAPNGEIFSFVEQMPEPSVDIGQFLSKNIVYPQDARDRNITGRVVLKFIVNETGGIENVTVVKSVYPSIDSTAVAVLKKMPKWKPGKAKGQPVKVYYNLPIRFDLVDDDTRANPGYDLNAWLKANLKYPQEAIANKLEGTVVVGFTVAEDGSITQAAVSIGVKPALDKEALRLVNSMPKWKPALKDGKPVSAYKAIPIVFSLKK